MLMNAVEWMVGFARIWCLSCSVIWCASYTMAQSIWEALVATVAGPFWQCGVLPTFLRNWSQVSFLLYKMYKHWYEPRVQLVAHFPGLCCFCKISNIHFADGDGSWCSQPSFGLGHLPERIPPEVGRPECAGQGTRQVCFWTQTDHLSPSLCQTLQRDHPGSWVHQSSYVDDGILPGTQVGDKATPDWKMTWGTCRPQIACHFSR